jgi:hypothetical protein
MENAMNRLVVLFRVTLIAVAIGATALVTYAFWWRSERAMVSRAEVGPDPLLLQWLIAAGDTPISVSPDGRKVLVRGHLEGGMSLRVDSLPAGQQLASVVSSAGAVAFNWRPTSDAIAYFERQQRPRNYWLRVLRVGSSSAPTPQNFAVTTATPFVRWAPDGSALALIEERGEAQVLTVASGPGLSARRSPIQATRIHDLSWSSDGRALAVSTDGTPGVMTVDLASGKSVARPTPGCSNPAQLAWSPDGRLLAVACRASEKEKGGLVSLDLSTGTVEPWTAPPGEISRPRFLNHSPALIYQSALSGRDRLIYQRGARESAHILEPADGSLRMHWVAASDDRIFAEYVSETHPRALLAVSLTGAPVETLVPPSMPAGATSVLPTRLTAPVPALLWKTDVSDAEGPPRLLVMLEESDSAPGGLYNIIDQFLVNRGISVLRLYLPRTGSEGSGAGIDELAGAIRAATRGQERVQLVLAATGGRSRSAFALRDYLGGAVSVMVVDPPPPNGTRLDKDAVVIWTGQPRPELAGAWKGKGARQMELSGSAFIASAQLASLWLDRFDRSAREPRR